MSSSSSSSGVAHPEPELELWIVRHGETDWNQRGIIQGQSESTLSELGASQAVLVADALAGRSWWRIVSSDLGRCRQTTQLILTPAPPDDADGGSSAAGSSDDESEEGADASSEEQVLRVGPHTVRLDTRLREMSAGIYEGLPRGTAFKKAVKIKADEAGVSVEAFTARGGVHVHEDPAQFRARAAAFLGWAEGEYLRELSDRKDLRAYLPTRAPSFFFKGKRVCNTWLCNTCVAFTCFQ
jgi:broad specificity phosphatase PhoE